jgi:L-ascorbate metabolism protein UlaG (beta-lactamase superfamily)
MHSLTFIGTATTLLRLGTFTLLTDPNFLHQGQRAYLGKGLWSRRLTEPAMQPTDLPALDAIVLSHLHGDHFDRVAKAGLARTQPVITTPAAARRLNRWGFQTRGLETWATETLERGDETLTVESLPAIHARGLMGALLPPVMGTLLEHRVGGVVTRRVYLSGDTLTGEHVSEISRRHPDIDVAVVHLGGTRILFHGHDGRGARSGLPGQGTPRTGDPGALRRLSRLPRSAVGLRAANRGGRTHLDGHTCGTRRDHRAHG